jgi:hypothetical protein
VRLGVRAWPPCRLGRGVRFGSRDPPSGISCAGTGRSAGIERSPPSQSPPPLPPPSRARAASPSLQAAGHDRWDSDRRRRDAQPPPRARRRRLAEPPPGGDASGGGDRQRGLGADGWLGTPGGPSHIRVGAETAHPSAAVESSLAGSGSAGRGQGTGTAAVSGIGGVMATSNDSISSWGLRDGFGGASAMDSQRRPAVWPGSASYPSPSVQSLMAASQRHMPVLGSFEPSRNHPAACKSESVALPSASESAAFWHQLRLLQAYAHAGPAHWHPSSAASGSVPQQSEQPAGAALQPPAQPLWNLSSQQLASQQHSTCWGSTGDCSQYGPSPGQWQTRMQSAGTGIGGPGFAAAPVWWQGQLQQLQAQVPGLFPVLGVQALPAGTGFPSLAEDRTGSAFEFAGHGRK